MLNPLIGIIASSGGVAASTTAYESIATTTVGAGGSSTITFSSIPATYTHLQIRGIARDGTGNSILMTLNSDTGANYARHRLTGNGTAAGAVGTASINNMPLFGQSGVGSSASTFAAFVLDLLDYANTNKYKTVRNLSGLDQNGSGSVEFMSGLWQSTSAVSTITLTNAGAINFTQYSSFALYGIKGA
jgi:hypothetical protein